MHLLRHAGDQDDPKANALKRRKDKERALLSIDKLKEELKVQNERHKIVMSRLAHSKGGWFASPDAHARAMRAAHARGPQHLFAHAGRVEVTELVNESTIFGQCAGVAR